MHWSLAWGTVGSSRPQGIGEDVETEGCRLLEFPEVPHSSSRALPSGLWDTPRIVLGQEQSLKSDCLGWVLALPLAGTLSLSEDPASLGPSVLSCKEGTVQVLLHIELSSGLSATAGGQDWDSSEN